MPLPTPEPVPPHHLCVIAAAVAAMLGESARVESVSLVDEGADAADARPGPAERATPWLKQGRTRLMTSHAPHHRRPHPGPGPAR